MSANNTNGRFEELVLSVVEPLLEERDRAREAEGRAAAVEMDEETRERVRSYTLLSHKPFLTRPEVALYLDVSERSIEEWSQRPDDRNPFPEDRAGSAPRYNRMKVEAWLEREARLRRTRAASGDSVGRG